MTPAILAARQEFDTAIGAATTAEAAFEALQDFVRRVVGARLFTVMIIDIKAELQRRAYTSDAENYPVSGTKPVRYNHWFETVHTARQPFVGNSIEELAAVFPDYETINALGCQSVVNLPVILGDELVATINMLDVAGHYTPERVATILQNVSIPAKLAVALTRIAAFQSHS